MKKAALLLLLIPIFLQAGGMMLICLLLQISVQQDFEYILKSPGTKFEKLILTKDQYRLSRTNSREIQFEGRMFDVKIISFHDQLVEIIAFNDKKEDGLIATIENYFGTSGESKKEFPVHVLKLLVSIYTKPKNDVKFSQFVTSGVFLLTFSVFYHSFRNDVFSPPPESIA